MANVSGLRSPYARVGRLVYFGRMLDKIRLHAVGRLPPDYVANLGDQRPNQFDARCCTFLGVHYDDLVRQTREKSGDGEILEWAHLHGIARTETDCETWNRFMMKIGWRDDRSELLRQRIVEYGQTGKPIETLFDLFDFDEGRDPVWRAAWEPRPINVLVLMGVSGCGKTTVGQKLAEAIGWKFADADGLHPSENIQKMSAGIPLNDADRTPWLHAIRSLIEANLKNGEKTVVACSALKESYRAAITSEFGSAKFIFLHGDPGLLRQRLENRESHYMKANLLESQLAALETPRNALLITIAPTPAEIVATIRHNLGF